MQKARYITKRLQHFNSRTVKGAKHWTGRKIQFQVPIKQQTSENKKNVSFWGDRPFALVDHVINFRWTVVSIQLIVNSEIFKLSLNLSHTHLRAQSACYELKGDLSSIMLKQIFHDSLKTSKFTRICRENHSSVTGWQKLFFQHTNRSNFRRPLQSLLLRYTAENLQVT